MIEEYTIENYLIKIFSDKIEVDYPKSNKDWIDMVVIGAFGFFVLYLFFLLILEDISIRTIFGPPVNYFTMTIGITFMIALFTFAIYLIFDVLRLLFTKKNVFIINKADKTFTIYYPFFIKRKILFSEIENFNLYGFEDLIRIKSSSHLFYHCELFIKGRNCKEKRIRKLNFDSLFKRHNVLDKSNIKTVIGHSRLIAKLIVNECESDYSFIDKSKKSNT